MTYCRGIPQGAQCCHAGKRRASWDCSRYLLMYRGSWRARSHLAPSGGPKNNNSCSIAHRDLAYLSKYYLEIHRFCNYLPPFLIGHFIDNIQYVTLLEAELFGILCCVIKKGPGKLLAKIFRFWGWRWFSPNT